MSQAKKIADNRSKLKGKGDQSKAAQQEGKKDDDFFLPLSDSPPVSIDGRVIRMGRTPREPKPPEAKFDRSYIPADPEAQFTRAYLLWHYDAGLSRYEHAEALLTQEMAHERDELFRFTFGDIGDDNYLVRWAAEANAGDADALEAWKELAVSAVQNLREDGILDRMQRALEKVLQALKIKSAYDRLRFTASLFALKFREKAGVFPTKARVRQFLKAQQIQLPAAHKMPRLWVGSILGRLKNDRPGRRKKAKG